MRHRECAYDRHHRLAEERGSQWAERHASFPRLSQLEFANFYHARSRVQHIWQFPVERGTSRVIKGPVHPTFNTDSPPGRPSHDPYAKTKKSHSRADRTPCFCPRKWLAHLSSMVIWMSPRQSCQLRGQLFHIILFWLLPSFPSARSHRPRGVMSSIPSTQVPSAPSLRDSMPSLRSP